MTAGWVPVIGGPFHGATYYEPGHGRHRPVRIGNYDAGRWPGEYVFVPGPDGGRVEWEPG
jgi:hypothetical protein